MASIEPLVRRTITSTLSTHGVDFKEEQENLNHDIDNALQKYASKLGGNGGNRPDVKLLLRDEYGKQWPVIIEFKGFRDKLIKCDENGQVQNYDSNHELNVRNINSYAVNGAIHYADAILHYTSYKDIIAIGVTGYIDEYNELKLSYGVYYVSSSNYGMGEKIADYDDLSMIYPAYVHSFLEGVKRLRLTNEQIEQYKLSRESEITKSLKKLNNDIYKNEEGLGESQRIYLVAAAIISTLGIEGSVTPLEIDDLRGSAEFGNRDGDIVIRKIENFLQCKRLPNEKTEYIISTLRATICDDNINRPRNGETQLKRVFRKIYDDLGFYYKIGVTTDFTGLLFNEMYSWLGWSENNKNDVVLTPSYIASLLCRLARVNKDSYVWDYACGSGGLLVAAMNEMIMDAQTKIKSQEQLNQKISDIKNNQILGIEILPEIYMLAVLNMILMGDGCSNIINANSLTDYNGNYGYNNANAEFPANAFVLNPPYSADGKGMVFVEKALSRMNSGYAAIIIHSSAGSGRAVEYNRRILQHSTLLASIDMPDDLFLGRSSVSTHIYVFRVGEPHHNDDIVKFINFQNDGYTRTNRKKASSNLKDTDSAIERYEEVIDLVRFGRTKLHLLTENEYREDHIDPNNGADWNKSAPVNPKPTQDDVRHNIENYLLWKAEELLSNKNKTESNDFSTNNEYENIQWGQYRISECFELVGCGDTDIQRRDYNNLGDWVVTAGRTNNGVAGKTNINAKIFDPGTITIDMFGNAIYRPYQYKMVTHARVFCIKPRVEIDNWQGLFLASSLSFLAVLFKGYDNQVAWDKIKDLSVILPAGENGPNYEIMGKLAKKLGNLECSILNERLSEQYELYTQALESLG